MDDQISDMQDRLAAQRLALQAEFSAADEAIQAAQQPEQRARQLSVERRHEPVTDTDHRR